MYGDGLRLKYPRLYRFWAQIKNLCTNKNHKMYCNYGGMGIQLYEEWNKYENFMNWAIQNGWDETKHINRIDSKRNFDPTNCIIENKRVYNTINYRDKNHKTKIDNRLYRLWLGIKYRCYHKKFEKYKYYGGRGIKVCDEWLNSFESFENWAQQNGYNDNLTIDRIDVNGNYEPSNCRWTTQEVQQNNKRNNHYIEYKGEKYTISQLARKFNIRYDKLYSRLFNYPFWTIERALTTP